MIYTVTIDTSNAAFGGSEEEEAFELSRILMTLAERMRANRSVAFTTLRDINGNTVGETAKKEDE